MRKIPALFFVLLFSWAASAQEGTQTISYDFTEAGGFSVSSASTGADVVGLPQEGGDCSGVLDIAFNLLITTQQLELGQIDADTTLSGEEKAEKKAETAKAMNALSAINATDSCTYNPETGLLEFSFTSSYENYLALKAVSSYADSGPFVSKDGGTISVNYRGSGNLPLLDGMESLSGIGEKTIKIRVPGTVSSVSPETSPDAEGFYVFPDPETAEITFAPASSRPPTGGGQDNGGSTVDEGGEEESVSLIPPIISDNMVYILGGISAVVVVIIVFKIRGRSKSREFRKEEKLGAAQKELKKGGKEKTSRPTEVGEDEESIQKLVKVLKEKSKDFSMEEVKAAIINQGYSEKIADEVLKRIYS